MNIGNNARVIKEIKYGYNNIIQVDEIVKVIHIYDNNMILIETSNKIRIKILKDKVKEI